VAAPLGPMDEAVGLLSAYHEPAGGPRGTAHGQFDGAQAVRQEELPWGISLPEESLP
jgi:hypothetical protein